MKDDSEIVNSYAKGFLLGALIGGAVGAVTALLFAPKPGKELREELSYRSKDLIEKGQEYFSEKMKHYILFQMKVKFNLIFLLKVQEKKQITYCRMQNKC